MTTTLFFMAGAERWEVWRAPVERAIADAGLDVRLVRAAATPSEVDYIVHAPAAGMDTDFSAFTRCKAVLGLWAGVEKIVGNPTLTMPLCRMVDPGLTQGMVEWVTGHVLRHHLGMDVHIHGQDGIWRNEVVPPMASERVVTMLGLGELGQACARMLASLGFEMRGWSRSPRAVSGVSCHDGAAGLTEALSGAEIVVLLLPMTAETENTLDATRLALLAPGAVVINPGRGPLIDDSALLAALDSGAVGHATLDVFRTEPLPPEHPFWAHPKVTVTPHIASATRPESAARQLVENIRRGEAGEPFLHVVDRARGY